MTIYDVIQQLTLEGNNVTFMKRKDGGYLITSINGIHYSGARGNAMARQMVGVSLSRVREKQLKRITPPKGKTPLQRKKSALPEELKKELRKVQRKWKRNVDEKQGMITTQKIRWTLQNKGYEEALRRLSEAERYATGYAYSKNIEGLLTYMKEMWKMLDEEEQEEFGQLIQDIELKGGSIREDALEPIYSALYDLNNGATITEIVQRIRVILSL